MAVERGQRADATRCTRLRLLHRPPPTDETWKGAPCSASRNLGRSNNHLVTWLAGAAATETAKDLETR
jgi:hypothetical protein